MKFDFMVAGGPLRRMQDLARTAAASGLSGLTVTETGRTAYLSIAAMALATDEIDYSTGVAVAFPRSPMITAKVAWELAEATRGRFELGLGTQVRAHVERRYSSDFDPPGPRMRDYITAVRAILNSFASDEPLDHQGPFYSHTLLPGAWKPAPIDHPDIPIYVAAVGPWMLRMAGAVADGVHVHPLHSPTYVEEVLLPTIAEGARSAGRDPAEIRLAVPVFTIVGDTEAEREPWKRAVKGQLAFYGSTRNYARQFDLIGFPGTSAELNRLLKAGDHAAMASLITDEMLDHLAVTSTWAELGDRLIERYGGVAHRLIMYGAHQMCESDPRNWDRWAEVAAQVRAA